MEEGGQFLFQAQAVALVGDSQAHVRAVLCCQTAKDVKESSGRFAFVPTGTLFEVPAELVLVAYGFTPPQLPQAGDFGLLASDGRGRLIVDAQHMTSLPGVFAGGSVVCGAAPLDTLVRDARRATLHSMEYLRARRRTVRPT